MFDAIVSWSLRNRLAVIVLSVLVVGSGVWSLSQLPIDAFPDTTPVQVQINTVAPALSPVEVEQQITLPVEQAIGSLPGLRDLRSTSKFGLSQVVVTFADEIDIYLARQLASERLLAVELPPGMPRPQLGPNATGLGEVLHYAVTGAGVPLDELTAIHDWVIRPQLLAVPGVAEVNTWGGARRQYQVVIDPPRLAKHNLTLDDVIEALRRNNENVGGGIVVRGGEAHLVQGVGLVTDLEQIGAIVVEAVDGAPILLRDLADVRLGHEIRRGAVTADGKGEVVLGLGFMLMHENSHDVTRRLRERLEQARATLPPGVSVDVLYDRTELVDRVIETVRVNLLEGALLVVAVLFAFLGNLRAGLIVAAAIPLAMLFSFNAMLRFGIAASLLSLGAIDFGLVVDSAVIVVENCVRRLGAERGRRAITAVVREATLEVRRPTMFGELIILVVYVPVLLLEGVEGKLFRPMALTVIFALAGSMLFSITLIPVLVSLLLARGVPQRENRLVRLGQWLYRPVIRTALRWRWPTVALGGAVIAAGAWLALGLGAAFVPRLYEEAIVINTVRLAGVSLEESVRYGAQIEKVLLREFPDEIRKVWSRTGTAAVATDPMGLEVTDVFVTLAPRERWTRARTQAELAQAIDAALAGLPGMRIVLTQPIEMRINEMTAGLRADLGVKVFGDDLEVLKGKALEVQAVLEAIPGVADVAAEQVTGQPVLQIAVDQQAIARHGVPAQHVLDLVEAIGGIEVGQVREGQRRFDLAVSLPDRYREDPEAVSDLLVPTAAGERLPLARLAHVRQIEGPAAITREWQQRRIAVQANVTGADLAGFVAEARRRIGAQVELPPGYRVEFGGQFEHLLRASRRLMIVVPLALAAVLALLYLSTGSLRDALLIATGVPFAALGGVLALWLREMPFTISAGIGFVAVSGVSVLNGLVLVSTIRRKIDGEGLPMEQAIEETRLLRLRAILMTALVAALGFVPMALNTGVGAEVQRPLATVVIGGVIADNLLTLLVLPALYALFGRRTLIASRSG